MARDYGKISTALWRKSKRFKKLKGNDAARLLYFYLHTCPDVNSVGCFVLPLDDAAFELGWNDETLDSAIIDLSKAELIKFDQKTETVFISKFLENSPITNKKHGIGAVKNTIKLPDSDLKKAVLAELVKDEYCKEIQELNTAIIALSEKDDSPTIALSKPSDTTETEPETDSKKEIDKSISKKDEIPPDENPGEVDIQQEPVQSADGGVMDFPDIPDFLKREPADEPKRPKRGTRISQTWQPDAGCRDVAFSEGFTEEQIPRLRECFIDYWRSLSGQRGVRSDWNATWRNYVRSDIAKRQAGTVRNGPADTGTAAAARRVLAQYQ